MKKKIVGILICTLLFTTISSVVANTNIDPTDSLGLEEVQIYVDDTDGDGMMNWGSSSNEITFALAESVATYNSNGPGIIIAFGQGVVNSGTGLYTFFYGRLRFVGFLGGGPSFFHTTPTFTSTIGQYTPGSFIGLSRQFGPFVIIFGFLRSGGAITGVSLP